MNFSTYRFTLDLQKHHSQMSIAAFQYDTAIKLYISLTDGGNPYFIEEGCTAFLYGKKADGTLLIHPCMIDDNNRIVYTFNEKTASEVGVVNCKIRIYHGGKEILTAPRFIIVVDERFVTEDIDIQDESLTKGDLSALDQVLSNEVARIDAEAVRVANENQRIENETTRIGDESIRFSNEIARDEAEAERESAETERKTAETARLEAEAERIANEAARAEAEIKRNEFDERKVDKIAFEPSDLNGANGILYGRYVEDGEVHDGGVVFGDVPNEGDIVQRTWNGNIALPTDYSLIDDDRYAVPKGFVEAGLSGKVDKAKAPKMVHVTDENGDQSAFEWSVYSKRLAFPLRDENGYMYAGDTNTKVASSVTTVRFVNDKISDTTAYVDSQIADTKTIINEIDERVGRLESNVMYVEDDTTAYEKIVPANAYSTALLQKISGATYRQLGVNLIDPNELWSSDISHTVNPDGSISFTISPNTYGQAKFLLSAPTEAGVYKYNVLISHREVGGIACQPFFDTYIVEGDLELWFYSNPSSDAGYAQDVEMTAAIMFVKDESATSDTVELIEDTTLIYKPYGYVLKHAKTASIESIGANLIPFPYSSPEKTQNGLTFKVDNETGFVTLNGTPTATTEFGCTGYYEFYLPEGVYSLSGCPNGGNTDTSYYLTAGCYKNGSYVAASSATDIGKGAIFKTVGKIYDAIRISIAVRAGTVCNNLIFMPMLNYGATAAPYAKFKSQPIDTVAIPDAIVDADYGKGVNSVYNNYIEFADGKVLYHKMCAEYIFTGSESWELYKITGVNQYYFTNNDLNIKSSSNEVTTLNNNFKDIRVTDRANNYDTLYSTNTGFAVNTLAYLTVAEFKAYITSLYETNTPLRVIYALENPEVIDITSSFPNLDKLIVEGGGKVRFNNDEKLPVPSSIQYALRV